MPTAQQTISSVLKLAYCEAKRLAANSKTSGQRTLKLQQAIELTWEAVKRQLTADDVTTRKLDRLIVAITKPESNPKRQGKQHA